MSREKRRTGRVARANGFAPADPFVRLHLAGRGSSVLEALSHAASGI